MAAKSIQAEPKRSRKTSTNEMQARTLKKAHRSGIAWDDYEVSHIVAGIESDATTFDMAIALGRTYYSVQNTRRMVGFAMRHSSAIWG